MLLLTLLWLVLSCPTGDATALHVIPTIRQQVVLAARLGCQQQQQRFTNVNSLLRHSSRFSRMGIRRTSSSTTRLHFWEHIFPFLDVMEPLEAIWEMYCRRDEIMDGLLEQSAHFAKRNVVRISALLVVGWLSAEVLSQIGVFRYCRRRRKQRINNRNNRFNSGGANNKQGSAQHREWMQEAVEEKMWKKTGTWIVNHSLQVVSKFRHFPPKSKFSMSLAFGTLATKSLINVAVYSIKVTVVSFIVIETLSFLGVIGERGESILEWIDDHDDTEEWRKMMSDFRQFGRAHLNIDGLLDLYQYSVDEERIATMGFAIGSLIGILT